jgi:hypothetical protein
MRLHQTFGHDLPALVLRGDISTEIQHEIARQGYVHRTKPMRAADLTRLVRSLVAARP